jgi:hypothetical protein
MSGLLDHEPRRSGPSVATLLAWSLAANLFLIFALAMRTLDLVRAEARQERVIELRLGRVQP